MVAHHTSRESKGYAGVGRPGTCSRGRRPVENRTQRAAHDGTPLPKLQPSIPALYRDAICDDRIGIGIGIGIGVGVGVGVGPSVQVCSV